MAIYKLFFLLVFCLTLTGCGGNKANTGTENSYSTNVYTLKTYINLAKYSPVNVRWKKINMDTHPSDRITVPGPTDYTIEAFMQFDRKTADQNSTVHFNRSPVNSSSGLIYSGVYDQPITNFNLMTGYYYLILHSSFGYGTTIKFEKKGDAYFLHVKTLHPRDSVPRLTLYSTEIDKSEWNQLENMIDEFDFWSAEQFKSNRVLDGHVYFLEGSRLLNKKRLHHLIGRGYPKLRQNRSTMRLYSSVRGISCFPV